MFPLHKYDLKPVVIIINSPLKGVCACARTQIVYLEKILNDHRKHDHFTVQWFRMRSVN